MKKYAGASAVKITLTECQRDQIVIEAVREAIKTVKANIDAASERGLIRAEDAEHLKHLRATLKFYGG